MHEYVFVEAFDEMQVVKNVAESRKRRRSTQRWFETQVKYHDCPSVLEEIECVRVEAGSERR